MEIYILFNASNGRYVKLAYPLSERCMAFYMTRKQTFSVS